MSRGPAIKTNCIVIILQRLQYSGIKKMLLFRTVNALRMHFFINYYSVVLGCEGRRSVMKYIMDAVPGLSRLLVCCIYDNSKSAMFVGGYYYIIENYTESQDCREQCAIADLHANFVITLFYYRP